jgi:uncharacterized protein (TIGR02145 family)
MKRVVLSISALLLCFVSFSQSPQLMSYQAVIRNSGGVLVANTQVGMEINIRQGSAGGTIVYTETQTPTTNANGLVSIEIGGEAGFSSISWETDSYFIETKTDPAGGTSYTITGTSQLLSVPYALHAKTAASYSETDPVFGDWDKSTGIAITESQVSDLGTYIETETDPSIPAGITPGEMQYWNGTAWVTVQPGYEGATLTIKNDIPAWVGGSIPSVTNPTTGEIWMDRNLGASRVAAAIADADAYGDLYQWGRAADGHQKRTSNTTSTLSSTDIPGHGDFICDTDGPYYDWREPQNDNLWLGVNGTNNPCPTGFRLPTDAEWEAERLTWGSNDAAGAFASPLKLPAAGVRDYYDGSIYGEGSSSGIYWSGTVNGTKSRFLTIESSSASVAEVDRAWGCSVRCIKD